jgi:hypothetical protein
MSCHWYWYRHHTGVNSITVLTCQLHQGLIAHGEHLTSRCQGWTDDQVRQKGWTPEVVSINSPPIPALLCQSKTKRRTLSIKTISAQQKV